jgi:hypothetical protein
MNLHQSKIAAALVVLGMAMGVAQQASAAILANGAYNIKINVNPGTFTPATSPSGSPTQTTIPGSNGPAGSWNSEFTVSGTPPSIASQGMFDTGPVTVSGRTVGVQDGKAGVIGIILTGSTFTVSSFQVDPIFQTAGGTFAQYANSTALMSGTIDQTTGAMTFTPTGRLGAFSSIPLMVDRLWNVDNYTTPGSTAWTPFTTGTANSVNTATGAATIITGHALVANGSGGANGVLVSGGRFGSTWGCCYGAGYFETWNISVEAVPVPAAAWLFGSGLLGLAGVARRRMAV